MLSVLQMFLHLVFNIRVLMQRNNEDSYLSEKKKLRSPFESASHCNIQDRKKRDQLSAKLNSGYWEIRITSKLFTCVTFFHIYATIKQGITQDRSDSEGQLAGKKINPVYKWYTLGPDDEIPFVGSESWAELCCTGSYFKVLFSTV